MTFKRISTLTEKINEYRAKRPHENVVVFISFDQLNDLRIKCVKSFIDSQNQQEYFMGCQLITLHNEHDYLAVAYEFNGIITDKQEV